MRRCLRNIEILYLQYDACLLLLRRWVDVSQLLLRLEIIPCIWQACRLRVSEDVVGRERHRSSLLNNSDMIVTILNLMVITQQLIVRKSMKRAYI
jgi:hypothetical protein